MISPSTIKKKDLRTFAQIWSFIFCILAFLPIIRGEGEIRVWAIYVAASFFVISFAFPKILTYFYIYWLKFGEIMGNIISKIILTVLFFIVFMPIGILFKILGKDLLSKKFDTNKETYWIERDTQPGSMENQF